MSSSRRRTSAADQIQNIEVSYALRPARSPDSARSGIVRRYLARRTDRRVRPQDLEDQLSGGARTLSGAPAPQLQLNAAPPPRGHPARIKRFFARLFRRSHLLGGLAIASAPRSACRTCGLPMSSRPVPDSTTDTDPADHAKSHISSAAYAFCSTISTVVPPGQISLTISNMRSTMLGARPERGLVEHARAWAATSARGDREHLLLAPASVPAAAAAARRGRGNRRRTASCRRRSRPVAAQIAAHLRGSRGPSCREHAPALRAMGDAEREHAARRGAGDVRALENDLPAAGGAAGRRSPAGWSSCRRRWRRSG